MLRPICSALVIAAAFYPLSAATSAGCDQSQTADFSIGDFDDGVTDLAVLGDNLFAAGLFTTAGRERAGGVAHWDNDHWTPVGPGQSHDIFSLTTHQGALFATGTFDTDTMDPILGVAAWNDTRWTTLSGTPAIEQARLISHGPTLYVVGVYEAGQGLGPVASWNGSTWTRFPMLQNAVTDAAVFNGSLYVCGFFGSNFDESAPSKIARWNGTQWASTGWSGVEALALATHNGALYAGTESASGDLLWKYDGTQWTAIPSATSSGAINRLLSTPAGLVAVGTFAQINNLPLAGVALWNGQSWQAYADGIASDAKCAAMWRGDLVVGGWLHLAGQSRLNNIAWWNGTQWTPFSAPGNGINGRWPIGVTHNAQLAVSAWRGSFGAAPGGGAAAWDAVRWNSLSLGDGAYIKRLVSTDSGLFAAGYIDDESGFMSYPLALRQNNEWVTPSTELAGGAFDAVATEAGLAMVGSLVNFTSGLGVQIAAFNNNQWSPLAESGDGYFEHITTWNSSIVVSGSFQAIDGVPAHNIAARDASGWRALGAGLDGWITALASFRGDLYAAVGGLTADSGTPDTIVYRFRNSAWTPLDGTFGERVHTFAVYDGRLYAGGDIHTATGGAAPSLLRLEGDAFIPLATQPDGTVTSLVVCDTGAAPSLFVLGDFSFFGDRPSVRIAEFTTCPCQGDVNHDRAVNAGDLSVLLARFSKRTDNTYTDGDLTGDRRVTSTDLSVLLQRFGNPCDD